MADLYFVCSQEKENELQRLRDNFQNVSVAEAHSPSYQGGVWCLLAAGQNVRKYVQSITFANAVHSYAEKLKKEVAVKDCPAAVGKILSLYKKLWTPFFTDLDIPLGKAMVLWTSERACDVDGEVRYFETPADWHEHCVSCTYFLCPSRF